MLLASCILGAQSTPFPTGAPTPASEMCPTGTEFVHSDYINAVQFSPDGSKFATASDDDDVKIWDANDGTLIKTLEDVGDDVNSLTW